MQLVCKTCGRAATEIQLFCGNCGNQLNTRDVDEPTDRLDKSNSRPPFWLSGTSSFSPNTLTNTNTTYTTVDDPDDLDVSLLQTQRPQNGHRLPVSIAGDDSEDHDNLDISLLQTQGPQNSHKLPVTPLPAVPQRFDPITPPLQEFSQGWNLNSSQQPQLPTGLYTFPPRNGTNQFGRTPAQSVQPTRPTQPGRPLSAPPRSKTLRTHQISRRRILAVAGLSALAAAGIGTGLVLKNEMQVEANGQQRSLTPIPTPGLKSSLVYSYTGQHAPINSVFWEPLTSAGVDLLRVASAAQNVQIWNAPNGGEGSTGGGNLVSFTHGQGPIYALGWCHSTTKAVTGNVDGSVQIFIADTGKFVRSLTGHAAAVNSVAWARDGIHIATGSNDMNVGLWPLDTAHNDASTPVFLSGHMDVIRSVSFSSVSYSDESKYLVSGSADHTVIIWSVQDAQSARLATYTAHKDGVYSVDTYPQQPTMARLKVVSGSEDMTAHIWSWDASTKQFQTHVIYRGHRAPVTSVSWSPDASMIASGDNTGHLHIWASTTGKKLLSLQAHPGKLNSLAWSPGGQYIATGGQNQMVGVYKVAKP